MPYLCPHHAVKYSGLTFGALCEAVSNVYHEACCRSKCNLRQESHRPDCYKLKYRIGVEKTLPRGCVPLGRPRPPLSMSHLWGPIDPSNDNTANHPRLARSDRVRRDKAGVRS